MVGNLRRSAARRAPPASRNIEPERAGRGCAVSPRASRRRGLARGLLSNARCRRFGSPEPLADGSDRRHDSRPHHHQPLREPERRVGSGPVGPAAARGRIERGERAGVQRAQLEHAIAILIGKAPAEFSIAAAPLAVTMPRVPAGLPSELLERRPDVAAAERRVAAANAQIGVAKAAYFPSLTLSASYG